MRAPQLTPTRWAHDPRWRSCLAVVAAIGLFTLPAAERDANFALVTGSQSAPDDDGDSRLAWACESSPRDDDDSVADEAVDAVPSPAHPELPASRLVTTSADPRGPRPRRALPGCVRAPPSLPLS
ncbi:MAG TPA: hypothetical protein VFD92_10410 [Candidatus Binatia bacterium]|nr:hypothetical protein [Candidatus Binatia bacterium]